MRSFIDGTPMMDIATEYEARTQIANQIPVEMINMAAQQLVTPDNRVVSIMLPREGRHHTPHRSRGGISSCCR